MGKGNEYRVILEGIARCLMSLEKEVLKADHKELSEHIKMAREEAESSIFGPLTKTDGVSLGYEAH